MKYEHTFVYNFEVSKAHCYCVGNEKLLVHNASRPFKKKKPNVSGKDGAKNIPSWAEGERPYVDESGKDFAKRLMDARSPGGYDTGPGSDFSMLKKYADRAFE